MMTTVATTMTMDEFSDEPSLIDNVVTTDGWEDPDDGWMQTYLSGGEDVPTTE